MTWDDIENRRDIRADLKSAFAFAQVVEEKAEAKRAEREMANRLYAVSNAWHNTGYLLAHMLTEEMPEKVSFGFRFRRAVLRWLFAPALQRKAKIQEWGAGCGAAQTRH